MVKEQKITETEDISSLPIMGIVAIVVGCVSAYIVAAIKGIILLQIILGIVAFAGVIGGIVMLIISVIFYLEKIHPEMFE